MISYELSLGLSIIGVLMITGSLSLTKIVEAQSSVWFIVYQPLGFIIYLISAAAECSRTPFDLTECENELVAGYQTEYSSMKFGLYYLAEYAHILVVSSLAVTLFFGGWQGPFLPPVIWFLIKIFIFIFVFIWVRATYPRFRYDQLMKFGWKVLFPLALANILVTGLVMVWIS
jgi:NADH-quinone oxidoreductase subunit H